MAALIADDRGVVVACPACGQKNRLTYDRLSEPNRCGKCKQDLPKVASPVDVNASSDFDKLIGQASIPVLVDFWAAWCGPCRMVAPEVQKVAARQGGRVLVAKVDTDKLSDVGTRLGIRSIPTLAVFVGGREVGRIAGARPAADIEAFVERAAQPAAR